MRTFCQLLAFILPLTVTACAGSSSNMSKTMSQRDVWELTAERALQTPRLVLETEAAMPAAIRVTIMRAGSEGCTNETESTIQTLKPGFNSIALAKVLYSPTELSCDRGIASLTVHRIDQTGKPVLLIGEWTDLGGTDRLSFDLTK